MKLYKIKMWVIDLDKPEYEQFETKPIYKEIVLDKFLAKKFVEKVLIEQFRKMLECLK